MGDAVGSAPVTGGLHGSLVGEFVLNATTEGEWLATDSLETLVPAVDGLERVLDALLEDLVAAGHEPLAGQVSANPVEGVLAVLGLVDKLGPDLLHGFGVALGGDTEVELVSDLNVDLGLDRDGALLVVLSRDLHKRDIQQVISRPHLIATSGQEPT